MKLIRFNHPQGSEFKPGIELGDNVYDLSPRFRTIRAFFEAHPEGWNPSSLKLDGLPVLSRHKVHLGPPADDDPCGLSPQRRT